MLDAEGHPLAGARVELLPVRTELDTALADLEGRFEPPPVDSGRTGGDGRFRLRAPGPGFWVLLARAEDHLPQVLEVGPVAEEDVVLPPVRMPAATDLAVRVLDVRGAPVAGALVGVESESPIPLLPSQSQNPQRRRARTDEDGTAVLPRGRRESVAVVAVVPGSPVLMERNVGGTKVVLRAAPSVPRPVEVRDAAGRPVGGAVVRSGALVEGGNLVLGDGLVLGVTGEDGRLDVPAPPAGAAPAGLSVVASEDRTAHGLLAPRPSAPGAGPSDARSGGGRDAGFAGGSSSAAASGPADDTAGPAETGVHAETAVPAEPRVPTEPGAPAEPEASTESGPAVPAAAHSPTANSTGRSSTATSSAATGAPAAATPPLEPTILALPPVASLSGRTLDPDRQPVGGAWVWYNGGRARAVRSDGRGEFHIEVPQALAPQTRWLVGAAPGHAQGYLRLSASSPRAGEPATILLEPTVTIRGRVVDAAGDPVEGVFLAARAADRSWRSNHAQAHALSAADGGFHLSELTPQIPYAVSARRAGFGPEEVTVTTPEAGRDREGVEIVLQPGIRAFGRVVDLEENPVAGAAVDLVAQGEGGDLWSRLRASPDPADGPGGVQTGADGRFELRDLPAGRFNLEVAARGFAPLVVPGLVLEPQPGDRDLGTVLLEPGVALEGRVVDDAGEPVARAEVKVETERGLLSPRRSWGAGAQDPPALTAADGWFRVEDLARGQRIDLSVHHRGYAPVRKPGIEVPPLEPVIVTLLPASEVSGEVVDEAGDPVAGAHITVLSQATDTGPGTRQSFTGGQSDEDGRFRVEGVEPGDLTLSVSAAGFQPLQRSGLRIERGETLEGIRLVAERGATVEGRVLGADGEPLPSTGVMMVLEGGGPGLRPPMGRTDADGRFTLEGVPRGRQSFYATHPEHLRGVRDLEVAPGTNRLDFRLERGSSLAGRVLDEAGSPVPDARVTAEQPDGLGFSRNLRTTTGENGEFEIQGVEPGPYVLVARKDGFAEARSEAVEAGELPVSGIELRLERGAVITGRLLGAELADLATASVLASPPGSRRIGNAGSVDFEGRYRVEGLSPGDWMVVASLGEGKAAAMERVTLEPGQRELVLDLDLGAGHTLTGRVLLGEEPAVDLTVTALGDEEAGGGYARSDHQGRFRIPNLRPGTYRLSVQGFGVAGDHQQVVEVRGDQEIEVRIPVGSVSGRVTAPGEGPVAGAEVRLFSLDGTGGRTLPVQTGPDGTFRFSATPSGGYRLRATKSGYAQAEELVEVGDAEAVTGVELRLEAAGSLTLVVTSAQARPPQRVRVVALDPAAPAAAPLQPGFGAGGAEEEPRAVFGAWLPTGEGGRVTLDEIPAGTWRILVAADGLAVAEVTATSPGPAVPVVLAPGATVSIVVDELLGTGQPARARLLAADGRPFLAVDWVGRATASVPLEFGHARISNVPAGSWTVEVTAEDGRRWSQPAIALPGTETRVVLE